VRSVLNSMPLWVLGPLLVGAFVVVAVLVFFTIARFASSVRSQEFNATIGNFAGVVQALFGLTLALVIVTLFQDFRSAQAGIRSEAIALAELARFSTAFPRDVDAELRGEIVKYIRDVRTDEWKLLRQGRTSNQAWADIGAMYATLEGYEPKSSSQGSFYSQALTRLHDVVTERKNTLAAISEPIPGILLAVLFLGAFVIVVAPMFLVTVSRHFQAVKVAAVSTVVGTALLAALVLSSPFSRALPISDQPYRTAEFDALAGP
jgi:hypothetical protein